MIKTLTVSRATAGFIQRGHPWVRPDRFTRGLERLTAGQAVDLTDDQGKAVASALVDPGDEICARVYDFKPSQPFHVPTFIERAWRRRGSLHSEVKTDSYRIVHGEADSLPGLRVERYGQVLVVLILAECAASYAPAVCAALHTHLPTARIVLRQHTEDLRKTPTEAKLWTPKGLVDLPPAETTVPAKELGITYPVRPFAGLATGLYVDQRATRVWLRPYVKGKRVLNLFAYTGAFSLSALAAGATSATDVDLAAPSLTIASETAAANGLADRHSVIQGDARAVLAGLNEQFDVIICDPPTAAQGGDGWVARRDYPELLKQAWNHLTPGGLLVAASNTIHGKPLPLKDWVAACGPDGEALTAPGLGPDLPQLPGFPEGRPFQLATRRHVPR